MEPTTGSSQNPSPLNARTTPRGAGPLERSSMENPRTRPENAPEGPERPGRWRLWALLADAARTALAAIRALLWLWREGTPGGQG